MPFLQNLCIIVPHNILLKKFHKNKKIIKTWVENKKFKNQTEINFMNLIKILKMFEL
jgi:hypothetical protein